MASPFSRDFAKERMRQAVQAVERASAAEIVVAVRASAGEYRHVDLAAGTLVSYAVLLYALFSPQVFSLPVIAGALPLAFGVGAALCAVWPSARRALAGRQYRDRVVMTGARATFVELAVSHTRDRSGVLVYVALLERQVRVLADRGVVERVPAAAWKRAKAAIEGAFVGTDADALEQIARAVEALAPVLEPALPRRPDDANELEDAAW